jgi:hypothetical protein
MKKLLALLLLFGIVGCATNDAGERVSMFAEEYSHEIPTGEGFTTGNYVKEYKDLTLPWKAEAMNPITGFKLHVAAAERNSFKNYKVENKALRYCKIISGSSCVLSRFKDKVYFEDEYAYYAKKIKKDNERIAEEKYQKQLILTALVDRCSNFGWDTEDNIASCVKQEAYRDLQIQEQEYKMQILEQRLASASYVKEKPFFLEALDILIDEAEKKENRQLRMDIMRLKADTRSMRSQQQTQAALKALYRGN